MAYNGRTSTGKATQTKPGTVPQKIDFTKLQVLGDKVIFYWIDEDPMEEEFTHSSGLIIARTLHQERDRWGVVVAVGPLASRVVGEFILPIKVKDPFGAVFEGLELWVTKEEDISVYTTDRDATQSFNSGTKLTKEIKDR